jgi:hypothetical protein
MSKKISCIEQLAEQANAQKQTNSGSCLCKKITFTVNNFLPCIGHCHCTMCQKFHGAAFSTFVEVKQVDLHWLTGEKLLSSYRADNDSVRQFCSCCGASLLFESKYNRADKTIEIALASFDHFTSEKIPQPDAHIYVDSKVKWLTINDGLPQFKAYRN